MFNTNAGVEAGIQEDDQLLITSDGDRLVDQAPLSLPRMAKLLLCALGASAGACFVLASGTHSQAARPSTTVRQLLEGDDLAEAATDNVLAMRHAASDSPGRHLVRVRVGRSLLEVSQLIKASDPESHHKLDSIPLTDAQKEKVLRSVRNLGDPHMVHLSHIIAEAVNKNPEAKHDHQVLVRVLSESLQANADEVKELAAKLLPSGGEPRDSEAAAVVGANPEVEVDLKSIAGRRLAKAEVDPAVRPQVEIVLRALEQELGDNMPKAPARVLSSGEPGFIECISKAVPNPVDVGNCMVKNFSSVLKMCSSMAKSVIPKL